jgi:anti-sigma factor RsiW
MIERNSPVTEDELHAFVDGELPEDRREAVDSWLASHAEDAALVAAWRTQAEMIRARYGAVAKEPVPERLTLQRLVRNSKRWKSIAAAAAIGAFLIGGIAGWMAHGASAAAPGPSTLFSEQALNAHRLYINEVRHPIEVRANEAHLLPWLSRRVGTTLRAPDLSPFGLSLLGGRLLPCTSGAAAALFMYESGSGERFTLYAARLKEQQSALRYSESGNFASVRWVESETGYAITGPADKARLKTLARSAYEQMENRPAPTNRSSNDSLMSKRGS